MRKYDPIDNYIYDNTIEGIRYPGIFSYKTVSAYIKDCVHNRINIDVYTFLNEMVKQHKQQWDKYLPIIAHEMSVTPPEAEKQIKDRLKKAFYGIFGEAILENMFNRSQKYELLEVTKDEDTKSHVDLKVRDMHGAEVYFQVKTLSWIINPQPWQTDKLEKERDVHEEKELDVQYAFFKFKFGERHFLLDDMKVGVFGYGNTNIEEFEDVMEVIFEKYSHNLTAENIIF